MNLPAIEEEIDISRIQLEYGPQVARALQSVVEDGGDVVLLIPETIDPFHIAIRTHEALDAIVLMTELSTEVPLGAWVLATGADLFGIGEVIAYQELVIAVRNNLRPQQLIGVVAHHRLPDDEQTVHHILRMQAQMLHAHRGLIVLSVVE